MSDAGRQGFFLIQLCPPYLAADDNEDDSRHQEEDGGRSEQEGQTVDAQLEQRSAGVSRSSNQVKYMSSTAIRLRPDGKHTHNCQLTGSTNNFQTGKKDGPHDTSPELKSNLAPSIWAGDLRKCIRYHTGIWLFNFSDRFSFIKQAAITNILLLLSKRWKSLDGGQLSTCILKHTLKDRS